MRATIYTKSACPFCISAKQLLEMKGVAYEEISIDDNCQRQMLLEIVPHAKTAPQIFIDGQYVGGFQQLKERFDNDSGRVLLNEALKL
jgi:glutaredoxin